MDYFTDHDDILVNKLGIDDPRILKQAEEKIVPLRMAEIFSSFHVRKFDFSCLKTIHRMLFSDIYQMAGKVRKVDMANDMNAVPFCYMQNIESEQIRIFTQLEQEHCFLGLESCDMSKRFAWLASELNALHPFRDGNGRAIRTFMILLAANNGYELDYSLVEKDMLIKADIDAFNGNLEALEKIYTQILHEVHV